jgi:periplasmic protein TonB
MRLSQQETVEAELADLRPSGGSRISAAVFAAAIHLGLAALLIWGLDAPLRPEGASPALVAVAPTRPAVAPPEPGPEQAGEAAPPAPRSEPMPRAAEEPAIVLAERESLPRLPGKGADTSAGSAEAGTGQGAGGTGEGRGSGGSGAGRGSGVASPPVRIAGALRDRDYPREAERMRAGGTVWIGFRVRTDGRVDRCTVEQSSGYVSLDDLTCRLVERRFRFRPALDAAGQPVETRLRTSFTWGIRVRG